jgi:energy-converting hydrogenase B subunit D
MTVALAAVVTPYTVPAPLMDVLQVTILVLVAAGATAVVLTRDPARQVIVLSGYGLLLAVLFLAVQAPDVTLSELTVGAILLPVLLLLTLAKVRRREREAAGKSGRPPVPPEER